WRKLSLAFLKQSRDGWATPKPEATVRTKDTNAVAQTNFTVQVDGTVTLTDQPRESLQLTLPVSNVWVAALRLELGVQEGAVPKPGGSKKSNRGAVALTARLKSKDSDKEPKLTFADAEADHKKERYASGRPILGVKDQWQLSPDHEKQSAVWLLDK